MKELECLNHIVETTNTVDYRIESYDGVNLLITGSFDFAYYHEVEVEFKEVYYISIPSDFSYPIFEIASEKEKLEISKFVALEEKAIVFSIKAETSSSLDKMPFFIVAENVVIKEGLVFYYKRENLKEGERIASWVKKSS